MASDADGAAREPLLAIGGAGLSAGITTLGAALWDLRLDGFDGSLVLGFDTPADYAASGTHAGAVVGRVANRLRDGRAPLDGRVLTLERNVPPYHLHGGATGLSQQRWRVLEHAPDRLRLGLRSPDGHEGYPGALDATAEYSVAGTTLRLDFEAATDAPTLLNMCHHAYFNLSGAATVADHAAAFAAERYLEPDAVMAPTGVVREVSGGPYDFRRPRPLAGPAPGLNHTLILGEGGALAFAGRVAARASMEIWTTQRALHVYDGYKIPTGLRLRDGGRAGPGAGFCVEAQGWTDAPNHPHFPSIELRPGERYRQTVEYRFGRVPSSAN
jgi:aldose 1-epimerase